MTPKSPNRARIIAKRHPTCPWRTRYYWRYPSGRMVKIS